MAKKSEHQERYEDIIFLDMFEYYDGVGSWLDVGWAS